MKINLDRVSEVNIAHRLANELTKITGLSNYLEYYQKKEYCSCMLIVILVKKKN